MTTAASARVVFTPSSSGQASFLASMARHRAFVGGVGSGKTLAGCVALLACPAPVSMVVAPTYPMLRDAALATFSQHFADLIARWAPSSGEMDLIDGRRILWRTGNDPDRLRGPNLGAIWIDEAAYCDRRVWEVAIGRLRLAPGRSWVTTTPKGKGWLFGAVESGKVELHRSRTRDNTALPPEYVDDLVAQYDGRFAEQELDALFVDWTGGLVTSQNFDRVLPSDLPADLRWARAWDLAFSISRRADRTASVKAAVAFVRGLPHLFLARPILGRWPSPVAKELIVSTAHADGPSVPVGVEAVASQRATTDDLKADARLFGFKIHPLTPPSDKLACATPWMSAAVSGRVHLVQEEGVDWSPWIEEWCTFPSDDRDAHDDCVDAVSRAWEMVGHDPGAWLLRMVGR